MFDAPVGVQRQQGGVDVRAALLDHAPLQQPPQTPGSRGAPSHRQERTLLRAFLV